MSTVTILRALLFIDMVAMALLALFFLRQRRLVWQDTMAWVLLAVLLPFLGPFLVILYRPGVWRKMPPRGWKPVPALLESQPFAWLMARWRQKPAGEKSPNSNQPG